MDFYSGDEVMSLFKGHRAVVALYTTAQPHPHYPPHRRKTIARNTLTSFFGVLPTCANITDWLPD